MKRIFSSAIAAALLLSSVVAEAVPITFEFSGALNGQRANGTISFESDGMSRLVFGPELSISNLTAADQRSGPFLGTYTYGGESITLGDDSLRDYGYANFFDVCRPDCTPSSSENWSLNLVSMPAPFGEPSPPGGITQFFSFTSAAPFDFSTGLSQDFFDIDNITIDSVLTLPLLDLSANYQSSYDDCSSGSCITHVLRSETFVVDSLTRRVGPVGVPEPGTLALFGAALVGALAVRRRPRTAPMLSNQKA
jgi:hypothetical protein